MTGSSGFEPLAGLRVLELGDGIAGASATAMLSSLGAEVTTITDPGAAWRTASPRVTGPGGGEQSLQSFVLDAGKTSRTERPPSFEGFDVVVCDRVGRPVPGLPSAVEDYLRTVDAHNPGVWVTISGFGLVGPRRAEPASDLVVAAAGGVLAMVSDPESGAPVALAGSQMLVSAGHVGALAVCHGLSRWRNDSAPVHLDVSAQAVALVTGPVLNVVGLLLGSPAPAGGPKYGAPAAFYPCRDGLLRISALEDHQWVGVTKAFRRPEWLDRFPDTAARIEAAAEIDALITELTSPMAKAECEAMLQATGVPAAAMYGPADLLTSGQFREREVLITLESGPTRVRCVGRPFRVDGAEAAADSDPGDTRPGPRGLDGLRVAEVGHVLAVPLAGALLGAMGADVVKMEDHDRVDIFRRKAPYVDNQAGPERAVYFAMVNHSKRSVALDLAQDPEALRRCIDHSDVLIENVGPSRTAALGLEERASVARRLTINSSAYGRRGPWASYRAYAYNIHAGSGLLALTRTPSGAPAQVTSPWADVLTGYAIATLVAAWAVGRRDAATLDLSMVELVAARFNEFLAAESAGIPHRPHPDGSLVEAAGGLVAVSPSSPEHRAAVTRAFENGRSARAGTNLLREQGIPAAVVPGFAELVADEQLAAFGVFAEVDHPDWGRRRLVGLPWRFVGEAPIALGAPPCFGSAGPDPWPSVAHGGD